MGSSSMRKSTMLARHRVSTDQVEHVQAMFLLVVSWLQTYAKHVHANSPSRVLYEATLYYKHKRKRTEL